MRNMAMRGRGRRCEKNYPTTRGKGLRSETTEEKQGMRPSEVGIRSEDAMRFYSCFRGVEGQP